MERQEPQRDRIHDEMGYIAPFGEVGHQDEHAAATSALMVFSRVKYWSAKTKGPRQPGQRPDDLASAAEALADVFELVWRAGYKPNDVFAAVARAIARRERQS
jgi:hypothetical protein